MNSHLSPFALRVAARFQAGASDVARERTDAEYRHDPTEELAAGLLARHQRAEANAALVVRLLEEIEIDRRYVHEMALALCARLGPSVSQVESITSYVDGIAPPGAWSATVTPGDIVSWGRTGR